MTENGTEARKSGPRATSGKRRRNGADGDRPSTIRDVAAKAGVSVATVSRALAGSHPVSAATRARVMAAVESLHYVVNVHAKALSGGVAGPVALVMEQIIGPSFADVAAGVEQEAAARGRLSLVCTTHGDRDREHDLVQLMREQHAAAVILVGGAVLDEAYHERMAEYARALDAVGSRLVLCGRPPLPGDLPVTVVEYDNRGGAFQAGDHLLSAGHRRILYLGGDPAMSTAEQRRTGYLQSLRAHGVPYAEELDIPGTYTRASGYDRMRDALKAGLEFTAVFAGTDMVATGVLAALRESGLDVPGDISIMGFDDVPFAADLSTSLTTLRVPYEDLGRTAVRLALDGERRAAGGDHVILGTQLVIRQSVRAPGEGRTARTGRGRRGQG